MAAPAEPAPPKTELQELQMKANQVTDEVSQPATCYFCVSKHPNHQLPKNPQESSKKCQKSLHRIPESL